VLLAGALRLVDDLQRERLTTALAHALVHHREVPFDLKLIVKRGLFGFKTQSLIKLNKIVRLRGCSESYEIIKFGTKLGIQRKYYLHLCQPKSS
jgi:hypothetical protein